MLPILVNSSAAGKTAVEKTECRQKGQETQRSKAATRRKKLTEK
jgi:hypothetical protein